MTFCKKRGVLEICRKWKSICRDLCMERGCQDLSREMGIFIFVWKGVWGDLCRKSVLCETRRVGKGVWKVFVSGPLHRKGVHPP